MNIQSIKDFFSKVNVNGVPFPFIRDPKTGMSSVSLTLLIVSSLIVLLGLIGKAAGKLGGIDLTQALYWNALTASLYFGRNLSVGKDGTTSTITTPTQETNTDAK